MNIFILSLIVTFITSNTTYGMNESIYSLSNVPKDLIPPIIATLNTPARNALHCTSHKFHKLCSYNNLPAILNYKEHTITQKEKEYALLWATQRKNYDLVKTLLKHGTNPNADNIIYLSPLTIARQNNDFEMIKILKQHKCTTMFITTEIEFCTKHNCSANMDIPCMPPFAIAVYTKDTATLQQCIDCGEYDPTYTYKQYCVNKTDYLNKNTILHVAAHIGDANILTILLTQPIIYENINITNKLGNTPCLVAAHKGRTTFLKTLLTCPNIDINQTNNVGLSPVYLAFDYGHTDIAQLLTTHKNYNVNAQAINSKNTQLYCAARKGKNELVKFFLTDKNIDTTIKNKSGNTALHTACRNNHLDTVILLLNHSPHLIYIQNNKGNSPLHVAIKKVRNKTYEIVKILLQEKNMNINILNNASYTPLDEIKQKEIKIIDLLIQHGAKQSKDLNHNKDL